MSLKAEVPIAVTIEQVDNYEFRVRFDGTAVDDLTTDEPAPLGGDAGPNPSRLLVAAIANCLTASLLFALRKFRNTPGRLRADACARMGRNAEGRWRVAGVDVDLQLAEPATELLHVERVLAQFENFCVVTESVREGVPVAVRVHDGAGALIHVNAGAAGAAR